MQIVLRSSSLFLTLVAIVSNTRVAKVEAALRRGVVGRLRIGMTRGELEARVQPAIVEDSAEEKVTVFFGSNAGEQPTLTADIASGAVSRIRIFSQRFRTNVGIGVGATLTELARFYPIAWREPGIADVDSLNMRFEIRDGRVASILVS